MIKEKKHKLTKRWATWLIRIAIYSTATAIISGLIIVSVLRESAKSFVAKAGEDLNRPCSAVISDMESPDENSYRVSRAVVLMAISEKLQLPVDKHPDIRTLAEEMRRLETSCSETPAMPLNEFLKNYKSQQ